MVVRKAQSSATIEKKKKIIKKVAVAISSENKEVVSCYCRRCMETYPISHFYSATDMVLDKNSLMSVCKDCISEIYVRLFQSENGLEKAMLRLCRMLNWSYNEQTLDSTKKQLETQQKTPDDTSVPGIYKARMITSAKKGIKRGGGQDAVDLTFYEPTSSIEISDPLLDGDDSSDTLREKWGDGMSYSDYVFLEKKLSEWKRDYSCQNKAELFLMKELSFKELELQKARIEGKGVDSILKSMDILLKSSALTPAQNNAAASGKTVDTWSMLIKQIEQTQPAEFYKDKALFKDYDKIGVYISNYIKRPIMNFIGAGKSFELVNDDDENIIEVVETTSSEES